MSEWTAQDLMILKQGYKDNKTVIELARMLNRTCGAVRNKAYRLKITHSNLWHEEDIEYLKKHYDGTNVKQIAEHFNRHVTNVCRKAREYNLTKQGNVSPVRSKLFRDRMIKMKEDGGWEKFHKMLCDKFKEYVKTNGHPRGMKGKTHTEKTRVAISKGVRRAWADPTHVFNSREHREALSKSTHEAITKRLRENPGGFHSRGKCGKREDIGIFVRSTWEANYARYLNFLIKHNGGVCRWEYEPDIFYFEEIKRGTRSYMPDFKVWTNKGQVEYHEIKGWMDAKSKTKLKRMAKYYPGIPIVVVGEKEYKEIKKKVSALIEGWE